MCARCPSAQSHLPWLHQQSFLQPQCLLLPKMRALEVSTASVTFLSNLHHLVIYRAKANIQSRQSGGLGRRQVKPGNICPFKGISSLVCSEFTPGVFNGSQRAGMLVKTKLKRGESITLSKPSLPCPEVQYMLAAKSPDSKKYWVSFIEETTFCFEGRKYKVPESKSSGKSLRIACSKFMISVWVNYENKWDLNWNIHFPSVYRIIFYLNVEMTLSWAQRCRKSKLFFPLFCFFIAKNEQTWEVLNVFCVCHLKSNFSSSQHVRTVLLIVHVF